MSEICYEPSQIFQPSEARAAPSWLGPPIRLLRSCPVFDALGVGREALRLGGILSNEGVLGYDEGVWNDEGNRQRLLDMLKAHAAELRAWASDAGVRLPSAESAGELREQVRDLPQEPQIQEQPGYGYQPGFQQPQQWQQQPWN